MVKFEVAAVVGWPPIRPVAEFNKRGLGKLGGGQRHICQRQRPSYSGLGPEQCENAAGVGWPVIAPVAEFNKRGLGKDPTVTAHV